jgi:hypothetical protein
MTLFPRLTRVLPKHSLAIRIQPVRDTEQFSHQDAKEYTCYRTGKRMWLEK